MKALHSPFFFLSIGIGIFAATMAGLAIAIVAAFKLSSASTQQAIWQPIRQNLYRLITEPTANNAPTSATAITEKEIVSAVQIERQAFSLPEFEANATLEKTARLLTLEMEDEQSLQVTSAKPLLLTLTNTPPKNLEVIALFLPGANPGDLSSYLASSSAIKNKQLKLVGAATREATFHGDPGSLVAILLSSSFTAPTPRPTSKPVTQAAEPSFTGRDLWEAVQNYRRSHNLPEFEMDTTLCTISSIRLNQQIELGKLDNHNGFQAEADKIFASHPEWSSINENLAGGYDNATQTVEWGWDQSLGHQALIQSRDYPKACASAGYGFAVLITGRTRD